MANGARGTRTPDLLGAIQALSQLSYSPAQAGRNRTQGQGSVVAGRQFASRVWFASAMGLLDDAIREHLELKRLRGADPGEVAREQREALDPVPRDSRDASQGDVEGAEDFGSEILGEEAPGVGEASARDQQAGASEPAGDPEQSDDLRETAELDMRTLLDEDQEKHTSHAAGSRPDPVMSTGDEDSLEWEVPGDSAVGRAADRAEHEHASGQERLQFEQRHSRDSDIDA
jgi:hypothetical protein